MLPSRLSSDRHPRSWRTEARLPHLWVHTFETIEDLRQALLAFREAYNTTWLIERHGFMTPAAARQKQFQPAAMAA